MTGDAVLLEEVLNDGAEVAIEVRYQGRVRRTSAGIGGPVILANASGQEYIFERPAIVSVRRLRPVFWPPREGDLWAQRKRGHVVHWVGGLGEEDDDGWMLYPNDLSYAPVSDGQFTRMTLAQQEEFLAGTELRYRNEGISIKPGQAASG